MAKMRWKGRLVEREKLEPVRGFEDDLYPMTVYWKHRRERRAKIAVEAARNLQALARPMKPPTRRTP